MNRIGIDRRQTTGSPFGEPGMQERFKYRFPTPPSSAFNQTAHHTMGDAIDHVFPGNPESFSDVFRIICEQGHSDSLPDQLTCKIERVEAALNHDGDLHWQFHRSTANHPSNRGCGLRSAVSSMACSRSAYVWCPRVIRAWAVAARRLRSVSCCRSHLARSTMI